MARSGKRENLAGLRISIGAMDIAGDSGREIRTLEDCPLAVVVANLRRDVQYANRAACSILGVEGYAGLSLDEFFTSEGARRMLEDQMTRRSRGEVGNYTVDLQRRNHPHPIPVEIIGLPAEDEQHRVIGSFAIFASLEQRKFTADLHAMIRCVDLDRDLVRKMSYALKGAFQHEMMIVSRYSKDLRHSQMAFVNGHKFSDFALRKRWMSLDEKQSAWLQANPLQRLGNFHPELDSELWRRNKDEAIVAEMVHAGFVSVLRRAVHRGTAMVGAISLFSRRTDAFSADHERLIEELPVDAAVIRAFELSDKLRRQRRLKLIRRLNNCVTVKTACEVLAQELVDMFAWSHVSLFRIDRSLGRLVLVAQAQHTGTDPIFLPADYEQPLAEGLLGEVAAGGGTRVVGNVLDGSSAYVRGKMSGAVLSEICCPVTFASAAADAKFIVNVEDARENAFSADEVAQLEELATEIGAVLERISKLYFLSSTFEHASEPIFVTDVNMQVRKANLAAARLVGHAHADDVTGDFAAYFDGPTARQRLDSAVPGDLGTMTLLRLGEPAAEGAARAAIQVLVSKEFFPEGLDGAIFVARDAYSMRRDIELKLLERAAYELALETSTPLALAMEELARTAAAVPGEARVAIHDALDRLARVKRSLTQLAFFSPDARAVPANVAELNLAVELDAAISALTLREQGLLDVRIEAGPQRIKGDRHQVGLAIEAVMALFLRGANRQCRVAVHLGRGPSGIELAFQGALQRAPAAGAASRALSALDTDFSLAQPMLVKVMRAHGGELRSATGEGREHRVELAFPPAGSES